MQDFKKLKVWQMAHQLTLELYKSTLSFPREELYGLTSQSRRSAGSIPTNIAEGCGRGSRPDFCRFLRIASGSSCELEYQLLLARDLGYLPVADCDRLNGQLIQVRRMLASLISRVECASRPSAPEEPDALEE